MHEAVCILCGTNNRAVTRYPSTVRDDDLNATVFSARRSPDRVHGEILRCAGCGLVYPRHLLDPDILSRLYERGEHTYGDLEPFIRRTYLRYIQRAIAQLRKAPSPPGRGQGEGRSIDIGCGNGFLLPALRDLGFDAWGLEPGADARAKADPEIRDHIIAGMASSQTLPPDRFRLLTCFQTLDHIGDPLSFLTLCRKTLAPGGVALFINHDIGSWTARLLGERCPMIDIEHTFLHTKKTMRLLFERAGFTDIATFSVRNDYPLSYWLHLLPAGKKIKHFLGEFLHSTGLGQRVLPLFAGNLGLIARRPTDPPRPD